MDIRQLFWCCMDIVVKQCVKVPFGWICSICMCTKWVPKLWMLSEKSKNFWQKKWQKSVWAKSEWAKSEWGKSEWAKSEFPQITASSMELFLGFTGCSDIVRPGCIELETRQNLQLKSVLLQPVPSQHWCQSYTVENSLQKHQNWKIYFEQFLKTETLVFSTLWPFGSLAKIGTWQNVMEVKNGAILFSCFENSTTGLSLYSAA